MNTQDEQADKYPSNWIAGTALALLFVVPLVWAFVIWWWGTHR
jgi:hypothetical protein